MSETRELLRRGVEGYEPTPDGYERVLARRDRKRRNQRIGAGVVGAGTFALLAFWLMRLLASGPTPAVPPVVPRLEPALVRNGEWVVMTAPRLDPGAPDWTRGMKVNLFVGGPDGSVRLLVDAARHNASVSCPAFSPDGSLLAYGETRGHQYTVVVSGFSPAGELTEPTIRIPVPSSESVVAPCPVWAPDGQHLATVAPGRGVLIARLDGTTTLAEIAAYGLVEGGVLMRWSPDGSQLALLSSLSSTTMGVWLIPADGGAERFLPGFNPNQDTSDFAWTKDGRSMVLAGDRFNHSFVEVVDVASGHTRDVPLPMAWTGRGDEPIDRIFASGNDRFLVWRRWDPPLGWLDLEGNVTPIARLRYPIESDPILSPDGKELLYVNYDAASGLQTLIAVPLDGGPATRYSSATSGFGDNYTELAWQPRPLPTPQG